jgi:hypothetical protein
MTVREVRCMGPGSWQEFLEPLTDALLDLEVADGAIADPDLAVDTYRVRRCPDDDRC